MLAGYTQSKCKAAKAYDSPDKYLDWADMPEEKMALPEKNDWNEVSPTAGKAGKRPNRETPPSAQSSMRHRIFYNRRLRRKYQSSPSV